MTRILHNVGMVTQSKLSESFANVKDPRYHFKNRTYEKFYSVKRYDREKFRRYLNYKLDGYKCIKRLTQCEIVKLCYLKDEYGNNLYYGDEKSIFRYRSLHYEKKEDDLENGQLSLWDIDLKKKQGIHEILYKKCDISPKNKHDIIEIHNIVLHPDEKQAEIKNSWQLPVKKRVRLHIRLIWLLNDYNLKESMDWMNEVDIKRL